jgi:hypothetical protein
VVLSLEVDGLGGPGVPVESDRAQRVHELGADVSPDDDDDDDDVSVHVVCIVSVACRLHCAYLSLSVRTRTANSVGSRRRSRTTSWQPVNRSVLRFIRPQTQRNEKTHETQ